MLFLIFGLFLGLDLAVDAEDDDEGGDVVAFTLLLAFVLFIFIDYQWMNIIADSIIEKMTCLEIDGRGGVPDKSK